MNLIRTNQAFSLTYAIGKSLYVPLTSRSNAVTLPESRGPGFKLPPHVVGALLIVRSLENVIEENDVVGTVDAYDDRVRNLLPSLRKLNRLPPPTPTSQGDGAVDSLRLPSPSMLVEEIRSKLCLEDNNDNDNYKTEPKPTPPVTSTYESLVFAGEGEPTLRFDALLEVVRRVSSVSSIPIRVVTNGLIVTKEEDDDDGYENKRSVASKLVHAGVTHVSVALMTSSASQYEELMRPVITAPCSTSLEQYNNAQTAESQPQPPSPHHVVCEFVKDAIRSGLDTELTGVDRPEVDKAKAESLGKELGVINPFRWRPYFP